MAKRKFVVLSYGMGVESTAIFLRWINDPSSRDFDLKDLIVITAQTGDEYPDTKYLVDTFFLPIIRKHGIRFVEVARAGHLESDGIKIIQDTTKPTEVHIDGMYIDSAGQHQRYYKLSDELKMVGTVPQVGGEHRCALKFKAFVIETWLHANVYDQPEIHHAFGYNSEEKGRIEKSEEGIAERNKKQAERNKGKTPVAFGFNADEKKRIVRSKEYNSSIRIGLYPLEAWKFSREACHDYIESVVGNRWEKSACTYCPFNACTDEKIARMKRHPEEVAKGVMLEHVSLSMNPRGTLYAKASLIDTLRKSGAEKILKLYENALETAAWGLYRVRRVYSKKGKADRAVQKLETGSRNDMSTKLVKAAKAQGLQTVEQRGITYAYVRQRAKDIYPAVEEFFVAAPATVETKVRHTMERFDAIWRLALEGKLPEKKGKAKKRVSSEVTDLTEMERIWKAYKKNGGTMSFEEIENDKSFGLKWANGMTAYRIIKKYNLAISKVHATV